MEDLILRLKNKPSEDYICLALESSSIGSLSQDDYLRVVRTILNETVPLSYLVIGSKARKAITNFLSSDVGVGNIVTLIRSCILEGASKETANPKITEVYLDVLQGEFKTGFLTKILENEATRSQSHEINRLFFRGILYSTVVEASIKYQLIIKNAVFSSASHYAAFSYHELVRYAQAASKYDLYNEYVSSLDTLNPDNSRIYFDLLLTEENYSILKKSFDAMRRHKRRNLVSKMILNYVNKRLIVQRNVSPILYAYARVLEVFVSQETIDISFLEKTIEVLSLNLNSLVSLLLVRVGPEFAKKCAKSLLSSWSSENSIKSELLVRQQHRTHLLYQLLYLIDDTAFLREFMRLPAFLKGVTARLQSFSNGVKFLGIILTDKLCEICNDPRVFKMNESLEYMYLVLSCFDRNAAYSPLSLEEAWRQINEPVVGIELDETEEVPTTSEIVHRVLSMHLAYDSDDTSDYESGEDDDDPTVNIKPKIPKPIYIVDVISYIQIDSKQGDAEDKRKIALTYAPLLIRQKAAFGTEVLDNAEELLKSFIALSNDFEYADFDTQRLNCMIAVVVACPSSTHYLCHLLATGDFSLKQRLCILTVFSLSARALRGMEDEPVVNSYKNVKLGLKVPPYQQVLNSDHDFGEHVGDQVFLSIQDELMSQRSEDAQNALVGPKILRVSKRLKTSAKKTIDSPIIKDFPKILSSNFFFPLMNVWYEVETIDVGYYSPIISAHFIKTLMLILHAAYPVALNLNDMIRELLLLLSLVIRTVPPDQLQLIEAISSCVLLICDISASKYLVTMHNSELNAIQEWLSQIWDGIVDERLKSLCAGLLLRIHELNESYREELLRRSSNFI